MVDPAHFDRIHRTFTSLLEELGQVWAKQDVAYVSDEVAHGEYGDALENLIAIGLRNGKGFVPPQVEQIEALAAAMDMRDSPFLMQLKDAARNKRKAVPR
ncbi:MAG: hypothetical protein ACREDL_06245 [Bradyrhizobium sp.]